MLYTIFILSKSTTNNTLLIIQLFIILCFFFLFFVNSVCLNEYTIKSIQWIIIIIANYQHNRYVRIITHNSTHLLTKIFKFTTLRNLVKEFIDPWEAAWYHTKINFKGKMLFVESFVKFAFRNHFKTIDSWAIVTNIIGSIVIIIINWWFLSLLQGKWDEIITFAFKINLDEIAST